jgi:hypothetical protein
MLKMQKKMFDNNIQKYNLKIQNMEQIIKEKDKELKMQANKIKELVYSGNVSQYDMKTREQIIRKD